jgi:hypothetical protein
MWMEKHLHDNGKLKIQSFTEDRDHCHLFGHIIIITLFLQGQGNAVKLWWLSLDNKRAISRQVKFGCIKHIAW